MQAEAMKSHFGELIEISQTEYTKEVTNAPPDIYVVVFLYKQGIPHCQFLEQKLRILAQKFKATKFIKIRSESAIPNYPDRNLPTLLIYNKTDVVQQFVGLSSFGGERMTVEDLEWTLAKTKAIQTDMDEDPRISKESPKSLTRGYISKRERKKDSDNEDEDD